MSTSTNKGEPSGFPTATLIPFPQRGGSGFRANPKLGEIDGSNVYSFDAAQFCRQRDAEIDASPERSPEFLLSLLILNAADATTKRCVRDNIMSMAKSGDEHAAALMAVTRYLPNAEAISADGQRSPVIGEPM